MNIPQFIDAIKDGRLNNRYRVVINDKYDGNILVEWVTFEDVDFDHPVVVTQGPEYSPKNFYNGVIPVLVGEPNWHVQLPEKYYMNPDIMHCYIIEAAMTILFMKSTGNVPDKDILDGAVMVYRNYYDNKATNEDRILKNFILANCDFFERLNRTLRNISRELIRRRISAAENAINSGIHILQADPDHSQDMEFNMINHKGLGPGAYRLSGLLALQKYRNGGK